MLCNILFSRWRRQTRLRPTATGEGLRGDVYYYSPCGKKLRTYPELNNVNLFTKHIFYLFLRVMTEMFVVKFFSSGHNSREKLGHMSDKGY